MSTTYEKRDKKMRDIKPADARASSESPIKTPSDPKTKLKIIIIDDNTAVSNVLEEFLILKGHEVATAEDGLSGLSLIRIAKPDLVICDIILPALNGYGIARAVRTDPALSHIYMVSMSGFSGIQDVEQALSAGFDTNLSKPVQIQDLEKRLALAQDQLVSRKR